MIKPAKIIERNIKTNPICILDVTFLLKKHSPPIKSKKKVESNFWMLFYTDNCYYIKKGLNGAITVHCQLKSKPEEN